MAGSALARHKRQQRVKWCDVDYGDDDAPFKQAAARGVPVG